MDFIANLERRAEMMRSIRDFFDDQGFVEVETPVRIAAPAPEPHIDCPAVCAYPDVSPKCYDFLRASPELQMKKLLAAGMGRIYQIGPCFREGEKGSRHNPEFTMLEWYRAGTDYLTVMDDAEALMRGLLRAGLSFREGRALSRPRTGQSPSLPMPFQRITVRDAYAKWAGWDPFTSFDADRFDFDMAEKIEPNLPRTPLFLMDYPQEAASLSRTRTEPDGTIVAERWELYVDGVELANAFSELTDSREQRWRFELARVQRRELGEADYPLDEDFLDALDAIPSAAGVALGVDRLAMLCCNAASISDVRFL